MTDIKVKMINHMNDRSVFKGSAIFNTYFGFYIFLIGICIYGTQEFAIRDRIILISLTVLFAYLILSSSLNYFIVENDKVVVRNCWKFWKNKEFDIGNIERIEYVAASFFGIGVKITSKNKKKRFYAANNLNRESIEELVNRVNRVLG